MQLRGNPYCLFAVVATGVFISTLDSSMVNIALPTIMREFDSPLAMTEWVVLIYLLTITASLLWWGHLADRIGRGKVYAGGLFIFAGGSFACAAALSLQGLLGARFLQALGAAMMMSTGSAIIKENFPGEQLGRILGFIGVAVSLGLMSGPSLGGVMLHYFSWRYIFLVTVPIGLVGAVFAIQIIPQVRSGKEERPKFDSFGAICWSLALVCILFGITHASAPSWSFGQVSVFLGGGIVVLAIFIRIEKKTANPILPPTFFRQRFIRSGVICSVFSFMALFSVLILTPFYLDRILLLSSLQIGLVMMAVPASVMVVAPAAGWLSDHVGARYISTMGLVLSSGGLWLLSSLGATSTPGEVAWRLVVVGCGQAVFLAPNSAAVLGRIERRHSGVAAALLATARNLGMLLGIAMSGLVFSYFFAQATGGLDMKDFSRDWTTQFLAAYRTALFAAIIFGCAGAVFSWRRNIAD